MRKIKYIVLLIIFILSFLFATSCELTEKEKEKYNITFNPDCPETIDNSKLEFYYFPKYIRVSTVDGVVEYDGWGEITNVVKEGLVQINERLASESIEYAPGKVIENIKTTKDKLGRPYYSNLFNSNVGVYHKVSASNPTNFIGEEYYEIDGGYFKMTIFQCNTAYMMYTHCGFNLDMLAEENLYFYKLAKDKNCENKIDWIIPGDCKYTIKLEEGDSILLPTPVKMGYTFDGWYKSGEKITEISNCSSHMSIDAKWHPTVYYITYDLDGGTNDEANPTSYTCEDDSIILKDAYKEGYVFIGWQEDYKNPKKDYEINTSKLKNWNLRAVFEKIEEE